MTDEGTNPQMEALNADWSEQKKRSSKLQSLYWSVQKRQKSIWTNVYDKQRKMRVVDLSLQRYKDMTREVGKLRHRVQSLEQQEKQAREDG